MVKGFIRYGDHTIYQMEEVTDDEMDQLIENGGYSREWPIRFDSQGRLWPTLEKQFIKADEVFYQDSPISHNFSQVHLFRASA